MNNPKISVVMTVFNTEKYLKPAIQSILNQSFKKWELIIVDDFSSDKSKEILKNLKDKRIRIFFLKRHYGRTQALNYALKKTKGKYIAILDSDDTSSTNRLFLQEKFLNKNTNINLVATRTRLINENKKTIGLFPEFNELKKLNQVVVYKNIVPHSSVMFRKSNLKKTGIYPKNLKWAQDYGLILKFAKRGRIYLMPKTLTTSRILKTSMTYRKEYKLIKVKEEMILLLFSIKNFKLDIFQKYNVYSRIIKNSFKYFFLLLIFKF